MFELEPASETMMTYYRERVIEFGRIADALAAGKLVKPRFSSYCMDELAKLTGSQGAARLIEARAWIGNYSDEKDLDSMRKAVSKLLSADGVKLKRGKRTKVGVLEMVADIAPILLYYGLPCASSERSKLVTALRLIAEEFGLTGDPRDELRRLTKTERVSERDVFEAVYAAMVEGMSHLRSPDTTPSLISPSQSER